MSSSFNAIERVDFSSSSRSPAMAPNYDGHDYYRKMLELQDKLRKSEEDRLRLEERFNQLMQESRNRHDACINRLRQRYIEFLEEQREKDERNHKLLGALDRVDGSLALMTAKTGRLNVLRKQYEAYLLRRYASRPCSSIAGDNAYEVSQNGERYGRRSNAGHTTPSPRQFPDFIKPSPYPGVALNEQPTSSIGYHQTNIPQSQQLPRICVDPPTERQDNGPLLSHTPQIPSQATQRSFVGRSPRFPPEPAYYPNFQTYTPIGRPETFAHVSAPSLDFRVDSPLQSRSAHYVDVRSVPGYPEAPTGLFDQKSLPPTVPSTRLLPGGKLPPNASILPNDMNTPARPFPGFHDAPSRFSALGPRSDRLPPRSFNAEDNELDKYIGKIKRLHRDLDLSARNNTERGDLDHEQNTSDDLLNVTLSEDELDLPAEAKARQGKGVKDARVTEDVAKVLALADDLASRKPEIESAREEAKEAEGVELVPGTGQERDEVAAVVREGRSKDERGFGIGSVDVIAPVPELENVDRRQVDAEWNNDEMVEKIEEAGSGAKDDGRKLHVDGGEESGGIDSEEQVKDVRQALEGEEKNVVSSEDRVDEPLEEEEGESKVVGDEGGLTVNQSEQKQEEYDVAEELEPWNMEGLTKQIRELRLEDESVEFDGGEQKNDAVDESHVQADEPEEQMKVGDEETKVDQPLDDVQESQNMSANSAVPNDEVNASDQQVDQTNANDVAEEIKSQDATFRQSDPRDTEEEEKYDERPEYGEHKTQDQDANYESQDQSQGEVLDSEQGAQQVEQYEYEQTPGYENGAQQEYQEYTEQNEQYGQYADGQYDEQYANDPNNQYDPNAQYQQNPEYGYEYSQQYGTGEGYENDPNQSYAYNENVQYDQSYENAEKYAVQQEYQEDMPAAENVENASAEQVEQVSEEKSDVPTNEAPKSEVVTESSQPKKKKDVIKSLLDSDTDSTIERNVSNTESDFDFN